MLESVIFYVFAILLTGSALGVVFTKSVVRMAVCLFMAFGSVAMLFLLLAAPFLAVVQLIVYAGGVLVLIVFGIMLTPVSSEMRYHVRVSEVTLAGLVCAALGSVLTYLLIHGDWAMSGASMPHSGYQIKDLGRSLLTDYLVPFEVVSVLLLVVMIGAAYLARRGRS